MKTQYELRYEEMITAMILSNNDPYYSQLNLFMDFHRNSSYYYDLLCDALYAQACRKTADALWLTPSGKPYLAVKAQAKGDSFLITSQCVPEFKEDLAEQLETALTGAAKLAQNLEKPLDFVSTM